jgi:hypothetical protein
LLNQKTIEDSISLTIFFPEGRLWNLFNQMHDKDS